MTLVATIALALPTGTSAEVPPTLAPSQDVYCTADGSSCTFMLAAWSTRYIGWAKALDPGCVEIVGMACTTGVRAWRYDATGWQAAELPVDAWIYLYPWQGDWVWAWSGGAWHAVSAAPGYGTINRVSTMQSLLVQEQRPYVRLGVEAPTAPPTPVFAR